ncbi:hypothetical protein CY91_04700 [Dehalococcoides mccartyi]|uniref:hypothetical protein n=1 Tax=Dehalococcoides mccartyi TaxID=61435 RepID=UPI00071DA93E|nr:hypothetical protein [Dehalococcoides mccartyi]KSV17093.1 hypothetical protein CY91_04700 [Dehalococcoides mccartyi]
MARKNTGLASRGSRLHLQKLVNGNCEYLNQLVLSCSPSLHEFALAQPVWVSPLAHQNYCEYRDSAFLEILRLSSLKQELSEFWPRLGPSWDALAIVAANNEGHGVLLLEAKSHFRELGNSACACGAKDKSLEKIELRLSTVKSALGVKKDFNWLGDYYQFANRIAHLYWLNTIEQVPTWMVLLYFIGDSEQRGPNTVVEWRTKLNEMKTELGLPEHHSLSNRIIEIFSAVRTT